MHYLHIPASGFTVPQRYSDSVIMEDSGCKFPIHLVSMRPNKPSCLSDVCGLCRPQFRVLHQQTRTDCWKAKCTRLLMSRVGLRARDRTEIEAQSGRFLREGCRTTCSRDSPIYRGGSHKEIPFSQLCVKLGSNQISWPCDDDSFSPRYDPALSLHFLMFISYSLLCDFVDAGKRTTSVPCCLFRIGGFE